MSEELRDRLERIRRERGFLLPHHGALAAAAPELLDAYFGMYRALTLTDRHLGALEKEFVWLAVLIAAKEAIGTHHLDLFRQAGGTDELAETALRLTGLAMGADAFAFVDRHWPQQLPSCRSARVYDETVDTLLVGRGVERGHADLALAAVHAVRGDEWGLAVHIASAYAEGVAEDKLAEALSLVMWPSGVNRFLDACAVWHRLMRDGVVAPSEKYRAWAETPLQGGFDDRPKRG